MRSILHIDMDAFFASVEQRDHPELKGKPVVVGAAPDQRGVVSTCSYEARVYGIHSAMPSREAFRRCPHAVFLRPDMARYEAASRHVFSIFNEFSPWVEPLSCDEAFVDVSGAHALFGPGETIARKMRARIRKEVGLAASIGVAHNKFLAKLGSERAKPDGLFVVPEKQADVVAFLAPMKVSALWGVGKVSGDVLVRAGLHTVGDLQRADPRLLERLLGARFAEHLRALALGEDTRDLETETHEKSISREYTFLEDCYDRETLRETLKTLTEEVGQQVRAQGFFALTGRIKVRWADFKTMTRQMPFPQPTCDDFSFREVALQLFDAERLQQSVRLIGFGVSNLTSSGSAQLSLFAEEGRAREKRESLCRAVDTLRHHLGEGVIGRAHTVQE